MKRITIFQENIVPIIIEDIDDSKIDEYAKKLSRILESNNISLLHTSSESIIIRPNKISAIVIFDDKEIMEGKIEQQQFKSIEEIEKQEVIKEDIITD